MMVESGQVKIKPIATYRPTASPLNAIAWSPDGTKLALGSNDGSCRILTADGYECVSPSGHSHFVSTLAFSPDGQLIATGSGDHSICIWESETGLLRWRFQGHLDRVTSLCFFPDGSHLASASSDRTVLFWDLSTGAKLQLSLELEDEVNAIAISASGQLLATGTLDRKVTIWEWATRKLCAQHRFHRDWVWSVAFSPDDRWLASGSKDSDICLWDFVRKSEPLFLKGHRDSVKSLAFSPAGNLLASGSYDMTVRIWDLRDQSERLCLTSQAGFILSVAFTPDGKRMASASSDHSLSIWDTSDFISTRAQEHATDEALAEWLRRQAASLGRELPRAQAAAPDVWVPHLPGADGKELLGVIQAENPGENTGGVALSRDGRRLYLGTTNGRIQAWDLNVGSQLWMRHHHTDLVYDLAVSPNGNHLATASGDATVRILNTETGDELFSLKGHDRSVESLAFSPDGRILASGSWDKSIRLWEVTSGRELALIRGHEDGVRSLAFSANGRYLASGSNDRSIRLWDPESGEALKQFSNQKNYALVVAFSPDSQMLAAGLLDGSIRVWQLETASESCPFIYKTSEVDCLAFSPDGTRLASGSGRPDATIRIWDISSGKQLQRFSTPGLFCWRLVWAANGAFLVAGLQSGNVHIYDTRTPSMLRQATNSQHVPYLASAAFGFRLPLPAALAPLPELCALLLRLGVVAPLSLLHELGALLGGQCPNSLLPLASHPGLRALQGLRWPPSARGGLIALLLNRWPGASEWQPPLGLSSAELGLALAEALARATPCAPAPVAPPLAWLGSALNRVDERLLTLLCALGPQAVAADPGLPLRLLPQLAHLPALSLGQRHLLGLRLASLEAGPAHGSGPGLERSGFASRGPITALLPTQWAFPRRLLTWRMLNGGLLFRTRSGHEPPLRRPLVILLDTSPATWGPIEALTRPAAHLLAQSLTNPASILLTASDLQVHYLNQPAERLKPLTHRSPQLVDIPAALAKAQALRAQLSQGPLEALILLLTHCWWGAEQDQPSPQPGLRALFIQYPNSEIRPPFATKCERWETVHETRELVGALERLIGH